MICYQTKTAFQHVMCFAYAGELGWGLY